MSRSRAHRYTKQVLFPILILSFIIFLIQADPLSAGKKKGKQTDPNEKSKIKLIYPKGNMIIYEQRDWIAGVSTDKTAELVTVKIIEKSTRDELSIEEVELDDSKFFIHPVEYAPGENKIKVDDYVITIFYQESEDDTPPKKYKDMLVHQSVPDLCEECHDTYVPDELPLLEEKQVDICDNCHKSKIFNRLRRTYKYIHKPVKTGECTICHEIHISENEHMLNMPQDELCASCHAAFVKKVKAAKHIHLGGMFERICTKCHNPHSSNLKALLIDVRKGICTTCHEAFTGEKEGVEYKSIHKPVVQGKCYVCHEIHKGANKMFLIRAETNDTCKVCHEDKMAVGHGVKLSTCSDCHTSHISEKEGLFTEKGIDKCLSCHKGLSYKKDLLEKRDCQLCHNPHSNNNIERAKASCNNCHEKSKLKDKHSDLTPEYKNCSNCHLMHGDGGEALLKANTHPLKEEEKRCKACHTSKLITTAKSSCYSCHAGEYDIKHPETVLNEESCVNCHQVHGGGVKKMLYKEQHKPFADRKCGECHKDIEASILLPELAEDGTLCETCHKEITLDKDKAPYKVTHKPFAEKKCAKCHFTHASPYKNMTRQEGAEFCYMCHKNKELDETGRELFSIHQPINAGKCQTCHKPHGSEHNKLLQKDIKSLCFSCHDNFLIKNKPKKKAPKKSRAKMPTMKGGMMADTAKKTKSKNKKKVEYFSTVHKPITEKGCAACHNPHSSRNPKLLETEEGTFICYKCHNDFTLNEDDEKIANVHEPVLKEKCSECHAPHATDTPKLLKLAASELCKKCHKKMPKNHHKLGIAKLSKLTPIPDFFEVIGKALACVNCHSPHSSEGRYLFSAPERELCRLCHSDVPSLDAYEAKRKK